MNRQLLLLLKGYARIKNDIGVAIATSGPGATNLITGIGSTFFDSIPCLYITGQVNAYEYKEDLKIRQLGFQETDIVSIVSPITKYTVRVTDAKKIKYELQKAIHIATSGRKGPVLLDIPMNIQRADVNPADLEEFIPEINQADNFNTSIEAMDTVINLLNESKRPVILVGGGVRSAGASKKLTAFAKYSRIPVVCSLLGLDAIDNTLENYCGLIGAYGNRYGNFTLANSDLIIALGSRLDTRQTGTNLKTFAREAKIIRVDIDQNELNKKIKLDEISILMDVLKFIRLLNNQTDKIQVKNIDPWVDKVNSYKQKYPSFSRIKCMDPNNIMHTISGFLKDTDIICLDVGQNQIWAAQSLTLKQHQRLLTSGGMGAMGFSLPAAIGAFYASPESRVIALCGDGGAQMNIQELQLLKRNRIPVKLVIMNNNCLGMIRHFQEMYFESRYEGTIKGYSTPDFCKIAQAYGIDNLNIKNGESLTAISQCLFSPDPFIIHIALEQNTFVFPKLAVNRPIEDQEPLLSREELKANMIIPMIEG